MPRQLREAKEPNGAKMATRLHHGHLVPVAFARGGVR
jgi:hypothetical protein